MWISLVGSSHSPFHSCGDREAGAQTCAGMERGEQGAGQHRRTGFGRAGETRVREAGPGLCRQATICLPCQHEEAVKPV